MSRVVSPATGKPYGVERVCAAWAVPRSSFYCASADVGETAPAVACRRKRGPKPDISDEDLLTAIKKDLARSLFQGEGHRKVWARLRVIDAIKVARKRVLRLMRENNLLSPRRSRQGDPNLHDGRISTDAPNVMWGTDGARVFTLEQGWVWAFVAVEHWNAECVGWHVCKKGDRFAALEPIKMGLASIYGEVSVDVARGLHLRMDHGPQYLSDHFTNEVKYWGITPSYAFVEEPQTNGVAERFIRTLREQVVYGRIYRNVEELRQAVGEFVERYNTQWLIEKNGFRSPHQLRQERCNLSMAA